MDDLLEEFLTETAESMDELDAELVKLEREPNDKTVLGNIFRLVHTIKGTCGFLGLPRLEAVAHAAEDVLGLIRDGRIEVAPERISLILEALDRIKLILADLEANEAEPAGDDSKLIGRLRHLAETGDVPESDKPGAAAGAQDAPPEAAASAEDAPPASKDEEDLDAAERMAAEVDESVESAEEAPAAVDDSLSIDPQAGAGVDNDALQAAFDNAVYEGPGDPLAARRRTAEGADPGAEASDDSGADAEAGAEAPDTGGEAARDVAPAAGVPAPQEPEEPAAGGGAGDAKGDAAGAQEGGERKGGSAATQTIRVSVDLLENLMTMVSELVLTRNQLLQIMRNQSDSEFGGPLQRLSHVTSELQEGVMKTRMQPIGSAWAKLPRIVRDLSVDMGKKIDLQMVGSETELDRQVLEIIRDPLTHMVRNSGDHGIERPEERRAAGKPETGTIRLEAYQEGGHIHIRIADDGKGLALSKIKQKVLDNGLATQAELDQMTSHQIQQFIFAPGFSTAAQVTNVSGRGVGMDVVKSNIDKIGGAVELSAVEGEGTVFTIKIPLTLAIVNALIVEVGEERFAIPQISVDELVRASKSADNQIETIHGTPVLRLREKLLPLVDLRDLLGMPDGTEVPPDQRDEAYIVVTQVGAYSFGIIVDRIYDAEEIVVKPTAGPLRDIALFAGNTILGDGSVIMILDPNGIAQTTGEISVAEERSAAMAGDGDSAYDSSRIAMLLFRAGDETPKAVPLGVVARLEEIDFANVEYTNGRPMVQYRGGLMPLVPVEPGTDFPTEGKRPTLVFSDRDKSMGLVVDEILDIVEDHIEVEHSDHKPGRLGNAVIAGKATEIIDTAAYITEALPNWFGQARAADGGQSDHTRLLLVDDNAFFRNLLTPILSVAGYTVVAVEGAVEALELYEQGEDFDIIVSDIEMPEIDGFDFARRVRSGGRWADLPMVAVTSRTDAVDRRRGTEVGFSDYVAKQDRERLLEALATQLEQAAETVS